MPEIYRDWPEICLRYADRPDISLIYICDMTGICRGHPIVVICVNNVDGQRGRKDNLIKDNLQCGQPHKCRKEMLKDVLNF